MAEEGLYNHRSDCCADCCGVEDHVYFVAEPGGLFKQGYRRCFISKAEQWNGDAKRFFQMLE